MFSKKIVISVLSVFMVLSCDVTWSWSWRQVRLWPRSWRLKKRKSKKVKDTRFVARTKTKGLLGGVIITQPTKQTQATCGLHAFVNAALFNELVEKGEGITAATIKRQYQGAEQRALFARASALCKDISVSRSVNWLRSDDIEKLVQLFNLQNVLVFDGPEHMALLHETVHEKLAALDHNGGVMHAICNLNKSHWVLLSVVKADPDSKIEFYYTDSLCKSTIPQSMDPYIRYIAQQLGILR